MKSMKKLATLLLCICMVVPCFSMLAFAVDGRISFNDPTVEAGQEVVVTATTKVDAGVSNLNFTLAYDPEMLEFVSAPNATVTDNGRVEYDYEINQNSLLRGYDVSFTFKALKEGTTRIDVAAYEVGSSFDIAWTVGYSNVTIGAGDSTGTTTDEPTDNVDDETIGSTEDPMTNETPVVDDSEIVISSSTSIVLNADVSGITLPDRFAVTSVTLNGVEYPAWRDTANPEMYILYASSNTGVDSLYQYDTLDNTYQRFTAPEEVEVEETTGLQDLLAGDMRNILLGAATVFVLLLVLVIVFGVKLYNRNAELDEVYDELDEALAEKDNLLRKAALAEARKEVPVQTETVDDIQFVVDEEEDEDDPEVEVEFYVDEPVEEVVEESVKEFFEEETLAEAAVETTVEEVKEEVKEELPVEKKETKTEEYYDDEEEFYDDLDEDFSVDFIDLDD